MYIYIYKYGKQRIIIPFLSCVKSSETDDWKNNPDDVIKVISAQVWRLRIFKKKTAGFQLRPENCLMSPSNCHNST